MKKLFQWWNSKGEESSPSTPNQPKKNALFSMIIEEYALDLSNQNQVENANKRIQLFASYILLLISTFLTLCLGVLNQKSWKEVAFQPRYPYFATLPNCNRFTTF